MTLNKSLSLLCTFRLCPVEKIINTDAKTCACQEEITGKAIGIDNKETWIMDVVLAADNGSTKIVAEGRRLSTL